MHTVAGSGYTGYTGDGGSALSAALDSPKCVAVHNDGSLCIADAQGNRIRVVDGATGIINTLAGDGLPGYGGDGGPATAALLHSVSGLTVASDGSLFLSDYSNNRIRAITVPLNVNEVTISSVQFAAFPNPVVDQLTLRWAANQHHANEVRILTLSGREMMHETIVPGQDHVLNLNGWSAGSYWVVLTDGGMPVASTRFVKLK
jgi:hypothetical protein